MSFVNPFGDYVTKAVYDLHVASLTAQNKTLEADKARLLADIDTLNAALTKERDENAGLVNELKNSRQAKEITPDVISRRLGIPLAMLDQIDLERLGVQMGKKQ